MAGSALNGSADAKDGSNENKTPFTTKEVAYWVPSECAEEASCLVDGDNVRRDEGKF
jgi:hypothetical protein